MIAKEATFIPNSKLGLCLVSVFTLGTVTLVMLALGAVLATAYLLCLTVEVVGDCCHSIAVLYGSSNAFTQLLLVGLCGYVLIKASPSIVRCVRRSLVSAFAEAASTSARNH